MDFDQLVLLHKQQTERAINKISDLMSEILDSQEAERKLWQEQNDLLTKELASKEINNG